MSNPAAYYYGHVDNMIPYAVLDAFCDPHQPGTGNPAAIVMLPKPPPTDDDDDQRQDEAWMQRVAAEFNLSETAFVWRHDHGDNNDPHYIIRYFTPRQQVPLCGHATLAAAAHIYHETPLSGMIFLHAPQDMLVCSNVSSDTTRSRVRNQKRIAMTFPAKPVTELTNPSSIAAVREMMATAFGIRSESILYMGLAPGIGNLLVELEPIAFAAIGYDDNNLNYAALRQWDGYTRGCIVCCRAHDGTFDFYSRYFAPKAGNLEDPVTGSAHCVLAPYFGHKLAKTRLVGRQQSRRGGVVECHLNNGSSVQLTGTVVAVMTGQLFM